MVDSQKVKIHFSTVGSYGRPLNRLRRLETKVAARNSFVICYVGTVAIAGGWYRFPRQVVRWHPRLIVLQ